MFHHNPPVIPPDEPQSRRVARTTARTVPWVMGTLSAAMREYGEGLHPSQFKMLMSLHHGSSTPSEMAANMEVSLPTVSNTLAVLERHGWVTRTADETDRRRAVVAITGAGRDVMRGVMEGGVEQLSSVFDAATPEELDGIERGMDALAAVLERTQAAHPHRVCRRARGRDGEVAS